MEAIFDHMTFVCLVGVVIGIILGGWYWLGETLINKFWSREEFMNFFFGDEEK